MDKKYNSVNTTCINCGTDLVVAANSPGRIPQFCSTQCRVKHHRLNQRGDKLKRVLEALTEAAIELPVLRREFEFAAQCCVRVCTSRRPREVN